MSIFVLTQQSDSGPSGTLTEGILASSIQNYPLGNGAWLLAGAGTAKEICERLGIDKGLYGTGILTEVSSYYGRANPAIWSWIKQNWEERAVG